MKLIIAGGRDYLLSFEDCLRLNIIRSDPAVRELEIVSGCARGVDTYGMAWAESLLIPIKRFPANWQKFGRQAGFIRNSEMAQYADAVILFPGGKGTEHMYNAAKAHRLEIYDCR